MSSVIREILEAVVLALVVFLFIQTSVQNFRVEGSSMRPTLQGGQYLLVNKLVYLKIDKVRLSQIIPFWKIDQGGERFAIHPPNRGEVIVFHFPRDPSRDFVKRIIGVPGDRVKIEDGEVIVNGKVLDEPYIPKSLTTGGCRNEFCDLRLKNKQYFVLGDNRRGSNDSRHWGVVPEENILGKVWVIYWPFPKWHVFE